MNNKFCEKEVFCCLKIESPTNRIIMIRSNSGIIIVISNRATSRKILVEWKAIEVKRTATEQPKPEFHVKQ